MELLQEKKEFCF